MSDMVFPSFESSHLQYFAPNPHQSRAITSLKSSNDQEILAWLAFARKGGFQVRPGSWNLTGELVEAFVSLVGFEDDLVLVWIHEARSGTQTDMKSQKAPVYWCTSCGTDKPKSYKNHDGWRREEKQHEATYICMLRGTSEFAENGSKCVLCNAPNPENCQHHIQACLSPNGDRYSCKRRCDMVKHLAKIHGFNHKPQAEAVASQWKHTLNKQAWSCGFCVTTFLDFQERLKHLQVHFEQGMTLDDWNSTAVIQGLLQQPGIDEAWRAKLAISFPVIQSSDLLWMDSALKDLQRKLEVGPSEEGEGAEDLVEAAYAACLLNSAFLGS